ncbi:nucleotidyltransferase domain-containing protein [Alkalimonas sp. MEB108]|uniref:Nucleotidyltransferase domain-containing protein n=1 Tax=Alkalimonas cellulosilytica TaxID=3058395 RepID=A0ABU7JA10_9GAMM|nr:nucleotidyltransferase domain-containing protein [Alkalimonas sp. MEB108]MEE2003388.1 nucleotidyltransferase domain-containing protein [Alkalimonas sp. MEB108]
MIHNIPAHALTFVSELTILEPSPSSIWLIGSRANGRATEKSDTDIIVFGSEKLIAKAKLKLSQPNLVDCLIVYDNNNFKDPWQEKSGSLTGLKWKLMDHCTAKYMGSKWLQDEDSSLEFGADMGSVVHHQELAFKIWP